MAEHCFTVDVEDYFQVNAFEAVVPRESWDDFAPRIHLGTDLLLDLLARHSTKGTFFTLGWVARRHPDLVRRIVTAGHELASHGFWHRRVTELTPEEFRKDLRESKEALEEVSGREVVGFRAPSFSIVPGREWALDILLEEGFRYDSSLFPIRRPGYGYPGAPTTPHMIDRPAGRLLELPPATLQKFTMRIPAAGGGYFRQFPYRVTSSAFRQADKRGETGMFYIHPWELDPSQPRVAVPALTRIRHYRGLEKTLPRLERLLAEFRFTSVADRFGAGFNTPAPAPA